MKSEKTIVAMRFMPTYVALSIATDMEEVKAHGKYKFPIYMGREFMESDLENLELSVRAFNCLKRANINTVGDLVNSINSDEDLKRIRNCGKTSITEIMLSILCYQYELLDTNRRKKYVERIKELNAGKTTRV